MNGLLFNFRRPRPLRSQRLALYLRKKWGPARFICSTRDSDNASDGLKGVFVLQPSRTDCSKDQETICFWTLLNSFSHHRLAALPWHCVLKTLLLLFFIITVFSYQCAYTESCQQVRQFGDEIVFLRASPRLEFNGGTIKCGEFQYLVTIMIMTLARRCDFHEWRRRCWVEGGCGCYTCAVLGS